MTIRFIPKPVLLTLGLLGAASSAYADSPPVVDLNGSAAGIDNTASFTEPTTTPVRPFIAPAGTVTDDSTTAYNIYSMTVTITNVKDGNSESLSVNTSGTMITTNGYDPATGELYLRGGDTAANFQKVLRTIRYNNTSQNPNTTPRVVTVFAYDLTLPTPSATAKTTVSITSVNDAPLAVVSSDSDGNLVPQTVNEDTPLTLSTANNNLIGVGDVDDAGQPEEVQVSVLHGTLTLKQTNGLTFSQGDGTSDSAMTFRGTVPIVVDTTTGFSSPGGTVGAALDGIVYTPDLNYNGSDTLTLSINDLGNTGQGGPLSASASLPITVTAVNDAPINSVPASASTAKNTSRIFNVANVNRISISDADAGTGTLTVTLTAQNGRVTVGSNRSGVSVSGDNSANVTLSGTLGNLNAALDGLTFTPDTDYTGTGASLTVTTNDNGNTGGAALSDTDIIPITVTVPTNPSGPNLLISEFRLSGPGGDTDEYIELANPTGNAVDLSGYTLSASNVTAALSGLSLSGKTIPAYGHLLITNSGYTLGNGATPYPSIYPVSSTTPSAYATGDVIYTGNIALGSTLTLSNGSTIVDTVGNLSGTAGFVSNSQYAFVRRQDGAAIVDTDTDQNDFNLVSTSNTNGPPGEYGNSTLATGARLGTPGPQNAAAPNQRATITLVPLDPASNQGIVPEGRYPSRGSSLDPFGRLTLRRTITNYGPTTLKQIRFTLVRTTSGNGTSSGSGQESGVADLRAITSVGVSANGTKVVQAIQVEAPTTPTTPSNQLSSSDTGNGGGLNASWNVGTLPAGGLAPGASMNVEFVFGIVRLGNYNVSIVIQTAN